MHGDQFHQEAGLKLYYSLTSPYARKVRVMLNELNMAADVDMVAVNVMADGASLPNPLGKIPCFITNEGAAFYDSPVICAWLEAQTSDGAVVQDSAYWQSQLQQALGDGIMDAAFSTVMEKNRPEAQRSEEWLTRWRGSITRGTAEAERIITPITGRLTIGQISLACALGYLSFRITDFDWRSAHPRLADWFDEASSRESLMKTLPGVA